MRKIHVSNADGRDATVVYTTPKSEPAPEQGLPDVPVTFRRYLASTPEGLHDNLADKLGDDYAQALLDGNPEIDMEVVGRQIGTTASVFLDHEGQALFAPPQVVEVLLGPDGSERERLQGESNFWSGESCLAMNEEAWANG